VLAGHPEKGPALPISKTRSAGERLPPRRNNLSMFDRIAQFGRNQRDESARRAGPHDTRLLVGDARDVAYERNLDQDLYE
jgi:hypothetical protein